MDKFKTDFHNHSNLSKCSREEMTVSNMLKKFEEFGMEQAGISDHLYPDDKIVERARKVRNEIKKQRSNVNVFVGVEVDMISPGKLITSPETLKIFDYIMVACSHYQLKDRVVPPMYFDYNTIAQNMFDYMMAATSLEFVDIIVHPFDVRSLKNYREDFSLVEAMDNISDRDFKLILKNMKENEIALELNTSLTEEEYAKAMFKFLALGKEAGVKFSLGSDAHWLSCMCGIPLMRDYIKRLQIDEDDIWTLSQH